MTLPENPFANEFAGEDLNIATDDQLKKVAELIQTQMELEDVIEKTELLLKEQKQSLARIQQGLLPDALFAAGLSEFKTLTGDKVGVKEDISISVPKPNLPQIIEWLDKRGHGDIVAGIVSLQFGKGTDDDRRRAIDVLVQNGFEPSEDVTVHSSTLKSILKKHLAEGDDVDLALFGAFAWKKSVIKRA